MIYRAENYLSGAYVSPSPFRDFGRMRMIVGESGSDYQCGGLPQQLRRRNLNIFRYFRCHVADGQFSITQFGHPYGDTVDAYWQQVLGKDPDDENNSAYLHTNSPTSQGNRTKFVMSSYQLDWLRFGEPEVLEFLFGANSSGIRSTDGQPGDVYTRLLWEKGVKYLFHDNFAIHTYLPYSGSNQKELAYNTYPGYEQKMWTYCQALRDRLLKPRGLKMIINQGACAIYPGQTSGTKGENQLTFNDFVDLDFFDGVHWESLFDKTWSWWDPSQPYLWIEYLLVNLLKWRKLFASGKIIIGASGLFGTEKFGFIYTGPATPKTFAYDASTKTLTIVLGANNYQYQITQTSTWADIANFLQGCGLTIVNDYSSTCNWTGIPPYFCFNHNIAATTISGNAGSPTIWKVTKSPRENLVTVAAALLLAAPGSAYLIGSTYSGVFFDSDLFDAFTLLGIPDFAGQPLRTEYFGPYNYPLQVSWDQVNENWGHVYYRLFTNGVAFLNWTDTDRDISANDPRWGSRSFWYPMAQRVNGEYNIFDHPTDTRKAATSSVTVRAKSGEVCLFEV